MISLPVFIIGCLASWFAGVVGVIVASQWWVRTHQPIPPVRYANGVMDVYEHKAVKRG
jgi:hypothetical protein